MQTKYKKETVHQTCFKLLPEEVKEAIFHAAFSVHVAWENAESMDDLDDAMHELATAMNPAWQDEYGLKIERLVEAA